MLTGGILVAAIVITMAVLRVSATPWVEPVGKGALRTIASQQEIAAARNAVIANRQNWIVGNDGKKTDPSYRSESRTWSSGPSADDIRVRVTRSKTEITDKTSATISIETIASTDAPTLLLIESSDPKALDGLINELLQAFETQGISGR